MLRERKKHQLYIPHMFRFNSVRRSCPCPTFLALVTSGMWVSSKWYYRWLCQVKYWMCVVVLSYSQSRFQTALVGSQVALLCLPLLVCAVGLQCSPGCVQSCSGARQPCFSEALWLALCVQGRGAAGPAQSCSWSLATLAAPVSYSSPGLPSQPSWVSITKP